MNARRVVLAVGPPGAGKTTLVRRLARQAQSHGLRAAVCVDEPGGFGVDLEALAGERIAAADITEASASPAAARNAILATGAETIFCELSASWSAAAVGELESLLESDAPARRILLLDAARLGHHSHSLHWRALAACADVVLLNKADTRFEAEVPGLAAGLRELAPSALVLPTVESTITLEEVGSCARAPRALHDVKIQKPLHWVAIELPASLHRADVERLVFDPPQGVERAKGYLYLSGEPGAWCVQITGRSGALRAVRSAPPTRPRLLMAATADADAARASALAKLRILQ